MEKRRLSAIMFTDIVGYTRKMGADEVRTLRLLKDHSQMIESATEEHDGEIIKSLGDGFLISFDSAMNAVICAIEIQQAHHTYNKDKPPQDQFQIRIGIHLGDIVIRENDVYGDGVNVASRVQPLAEPGGICVTRTIYDVVKKKMDVKAVELGPQELKNVDEAVEVFHLISDTVGIKELRKARRVKKRQRSTLIPYVSLGVAVLIIVLILWRQGVFRSGGVDELLKLVQNAEVPENRVAVLPLRNLTGRDEDQYMCEGFAQDVIYRMTPAQDIYVHPLENVLRIEERMRTYDIVRKNLGATYMVSGAIERDGDSLSITIELSDTQKGRRLFSKRYRTSASDRIQVQERTAGDLLFQVVGRVSGEAGHIAALTSRDPRANDLYQQALAIDPERYIKVREAEKGLADKYMELLEAAIEIDSNFVMACCQLAKAYNFFSFREHFWYDDTTKQRFKATALKLAESTVDLAPLIPEAHLTYGLLLMQEDDTSGAERELSEALRLRPLYPPTLMALADLYHKQGKETQASAYGRDALRIYREFNDRLGERDAFLLLGLLEDRNPQEEIEYHEKLLAMTQELDYDHYQKAWDLAYYRCFFGGYERIGDIKRERDEMNIAADILHTIIDTLSAPEGVKDDNFITILFVFPLHRRIAEKDLILGDYQDALSQYQSANRIGRILDEPRLWFPLFDLIDIYLILDDMHNARRLLSEIETTMREDSALAEIWSSNLSHYKGNMFFSQAKLDSARYYYEQALSASSAKSNLMCAIGECQFLAGAFDSCRVTLNVVIADTTSEPDIRNRAAFFLASTDVVSGNIDDGLKRTETCLDSMRLYADKVKAHRILSELYSDLGRNEEAEEHLAEGRAMAEKSGMKGELKKYDLLLDRMKGL